MICRESAFYGQFRCLGGDCPLTCCRDWSIVLDEAALRDYATAPQPLRERIAQSLVTDEDGDVCFALRPDGLCALLDGDGLCPIQRHWGEEHLCAHCGAYPRFIEEYGCMTERCQAVSCPEAARLVLEQGILPLAETDDGVDDPPFDGVDGGLLALLLTARTRAFALLAAEGTPLWGRLSALLRDAAAVQAAIDGGGDLPAPLPAIPSPADPPGLGETAASLLELLARLDPLRAEWPALLRARAGALRELTAEGCAALAARYAAARPGWDERLRRLAEYLVFRHYPKAVNDDGLYPRAALAAALCLCLHHLSMLAWAEGPDFSHREEALLWAAMSREVEHLDENFFALAEALSDPARWPLADLLGRLEKRT